MFLHYYLVISIDLKFSENFKFQFVLSTTDACISESLVSELSALNKFEDALETLKNTTGITVKKKNNEYRIRGMLFI